VQQIKAFCPRNPCSYLINKLKGLLVVKIVYKFESSKDHILKYRELLPEINRYFPCHGWIGGPDNMRVVCLPVLSFFTFEEPYCKIFTKNNLIGGWLQSRSPERTIRLLGICFRDLHKEFREIFPLIDRSVESSNNINQQSEEFTRFQEGTERIELFLIAAFTLLRRLADELIDASRPILFNNWKSAPREMKKAIQFAREDKLKRLNPICNIDILINALINHTRWFSRLREENGIRDIIIHKPHTLQISSEGIKNEENDTWTRRISAHLVRYDKNIIAIDLLDTLFNCIDESCKFMELLCCSVGHIHGYEEDSFAWSGCLLMTGMDNDIVGIWPPLVSKRTEFPLME
jgi:hypothetical protein